MGLMDRRRAIVLFGDSLTQRSWEPHGWGAALAHRYGRRCDVYNRGYGGYNTRWCRSMLDELFPPDEHPLLVTVMLGTNDAALANVEPGATVPLDEYSENLTAIVRRVKQRSRRVIIMTPPCMDEPARLAFQREKYGDRALGRLERTNANTARYAEAAKSVASALGVPCVDLFAATTEASRRSASTIFEDGIHFNAEGQRVVFEALEECLRTMPGFEALEPEGMEPDWPFGPQLRPNPGTWRETMAAHEAAAAGSWEPLRGAGGRLNWTTGLRIGLGVGMAVGFAVGRWR